MKRAQKSQHFRLPVGLLARINAFASAHGMTVSAVIRLGLQRGFAAMETEASHPAPTETTGEPLPPPPRRRVLSPGI